MYADDQAIVGGLARLDGRPIMLIGHQKGRDTKERVRRNYGMPKPEGYRKALRLMKLAERFRLPVVTLVDTPGAYPGVGSEERNQSEAIARNLFEMARLRVPVITAVIGEGGSGGALAIGVCDRLIMLQYSVYSVISPEGCASILWKSADKKELAAEAMGITAERLMRLGLVDEVLKEPLGGAHRDPQAMADSLKEALLRHLAEVSAWPEEELVAAPLRTAAGTGRVHARPEPVAFTPGRLSVALDGVPRDRSIRPRRACCVALSGGLDSTVLLAALVAARGANRAAAAARHPRRSRPACRLRALGRRIAPRRRPHSACRSSRPGCDARPSRGESPEAAARAARYAALAERLAPGEVLLTAHHADDQLESILLQWLRGGGVRAVAGMPAIGRFARGWHARPLLGFTREELAGLGGARERLRVARRIPRISMRASTAITCGSRCCPRSAGAGPRRRGRSARVAGTRRSCSTWRPRSRAPDLALAAGRPRAVARAAADCCRRRASAGCSAPGCARRACRCRRSRRSPRRCATWPWRPTTACPARTGPARACIATGAGCMPRRRRRAGATVPDGDWSPGAGFDAGRARIAWNSCPARARA